MHLGYLFNVIIANNITQSDLFFLKEIPVWDKGINFHGNQWERMGTMSNYNLYTTTYSMPITVIQSSPCASAHIMSNDLLGTRWHWEKILSNTAVTLGQWAKEKWSLEVPPLDCSCGFQCSHPVRVTNSLGHLSFIHGGSYSHRHTLVTDVMVVE